MTEPTYDAETSIVIDVITALIRYSFPAGDIEMDINEDWPICSLVFVCRWNIPYRSVSDNNKACETSILKQL